MTGRAGIVLAGGRSRRFGPTDKALAEVDGDPLLARVVDRTSTVTDDVIVTCRSSQVDPFGRTLSSAPVDEIVEDRHPDAGPLAGIEAGLAAVSREYTAILACDMPFVEPAVLETLFDRADGVDAAVPEQPDGRLQPVHAVYRTNALQRAVARILPGGGSVHEVLDTLEVVTVPSQSVPSRSLFDVNTRADLVDAERRQHTDR